MGFSGGSLAGREIVTVGASSGGVEALMGVIGGLPGDLPAAVLIVVHLPESAPSALPLILDRIGPLEAVRAEDGEPIKSGRIYVAPPDVHLLVENGRVRLTRGPKENRHRPAVSPFNARRNPVPPALLFRI
jgi:two-component system, chemotaxis family, protein-glutamate methylesterase/glutaminase